MALLGSNLPTPKKISTNANTMTVPSLLSFLLFTMSVVGIHGFPSMLTDGRMGCMTDLSTDEVIMNNPVVPFSDSPHPDIALGWKHVVGGGGGDEGQTMHTDKEIVIKEVPFSLRFYLVVPPDSGARDVQYVVETTVQPGVYFENGGCDDKRRVGGKVFGDRGNVWHVEQMPTKPIEIWAGWATGHEAVKLTDKIIVTAATAAAASDGAASDTTTTTTTTKEETGVIENEGSEEVDREVENMVEEVMELEEAEETERQAMVQELGDDDDSTMMEDEKKQGNGGDGGFSMEMMQRVLKDKMALVEEAQRLSDKKKHHLEGMKKWRERLEEKPQFHQDLVREGRAHQITDEQLEHVTAKLEQLNLAKKTRKTNDDDNKDGNKDGEGAASSSGKAWEAFQHQRHPQHRLDRKQPNFGGFNLQDRETYRKKIEQDQELRKKRELYAQKEQKLDNEKIRDLFRQQTKFMMEQQQQQQDQDPQKQQPPQKMLRQQLNQQVLHKQMQEEMQKHQEQKEVGAPDSQKKKGTVDNNDNKNHHVMASDEMYKMRDLDFGTFKKHLKEHPEMYPDRVRAKVLEIEKEELEKEKAASAAAAKAKQEAENAQYDDDEYADDKAEGIVYKKPPNNNKKKPPVFLEKIAQKYNDDDLLAIDTVQFLFAVVFFVLSTLLAIQICLWTGHIDKGELDN